MDWSEKTFGEASTNAVTTDNTHKGGSNSGNKSIDDMSRKDINEKGINQKDVYTRDTKVAWLTQKWIYDLLHPFIHEANKRTGWDWNWDYSEPVQFTKYGVRQFYGWHMDCNEEPYELFDPSKHPYALNTDGTLKLDARGNKMPKNYYHAVDPNFHGKIRKISMTCNLSNPDDYEGGNLRFDFGPHAGEKRFHTCEEIRPRGSIIVFPSHLYHQVTPVLSGTRYSLVMWCLGQPFQ